MCSPRTWGLHHEQDVALCPLQQPQHSPVAPLFSGTCEEKKLGDVRGYDIQPQQGLQSRSSIPSTSSILFQPINILSNFPFCSYIYIRRGRTAQESSSFSPHGSEPFHWNTQLQNHAAKASKSTEPQPQNLDYHCWYHPVLPFTVTEQISVFQCPCYPTAHACTLSVTDWHQLFCTSSSWIFTFCCGVGRLTAARMEGKNRYFH